MKKILAGLLMGVLFLTVAPYRSYGETCGCAGAGMHGEGMPMMERMRHRDMWMRGPGMWAQLRRLGLDEKQRAEAREIWDASMKDVITKTADVRIKRIELREILAKDPVDMHAVGDKLKEIATVQADIRFSHIKAMEDIKALLTPKQRKKLRENFEKYRGPGRPWRGAHGRAPMAAPDGERGKMTEDMDPMD